MLTLACALASLAVKLKDTESCLSNVQLDGIGRLVHSLGVWSQPDFPLKVSSPAWSATCTDHSVVVVVCLERWALLTELFRL